MATTQKRGDGNATNDFFCMDPDCERAPKAPELLPASEAIERGMKACPACSKKRVYMRPQASGDSPFHFDDGCRYVHGNHGERRLAVMIAWEFRPCKECDPEVYA